MTSLRRRSSLGTLLLFALAAAAILAGLSREPYQPDEGMWIFQGQKAWALLRGGDWEHREWSNIDATWGYVNPPVAKYMIGLSLQAQGVAWSWHPGEPPAAVLVAARRGSALLGVGGLLGLLWLGRRTISGSGALLAAALMLASPLWISAARHAMTDVHGAALAILAFAAFAPAMREWQDARRAPRVVAWIVLAAALSGLAVGAKLNAVSTPAALGCLILLAAGQEIRCGRVRGLLWACGLGVLFAAISAAVFVVSNPYLYPDPWERFVGILSWWREHGERQIRASELGRFGRAFRPQESGLRVLTAKLLFPVRPETLALLAPLLGGLLARLALRRGSPRFPRLLGWLLLIPAATFAGATQNGIAHAWIVWFGSLGAVVTACVSRRESGWEKAALRAAPLAVWGAVVAFFLWRMTTLPTTRYYLPLLPVLCLLAGQAFAALRDDVLAAAGRGAQRTLDAGIIAALAATLVSNPDYDRSVLETMLRGGAPALARGLHWVSLAAIATALLAALHRDRFPAVSPTDTPLAAAGPL